MENAFQRAAALAVNAVLGINHKLWVLPGLLHHILVDACWTETLFWGTINLHRRRLRHVCEFLLDSPDMDHLGQDRETPQASF